MSDRLSTSGLPDVIQFSVSIPVALAAVETLISAVVAAAAALPPDPRIDEIVATIKRIETMSTTISQQQDANTAKVVADLDVIKTGIADLRAQIAAIPPPVQGEVVTQAQEDAFAAVVATADAMAASFAPGTPPSHTPLDTSDSTPNSAGGRNNFFLSGFDPSQPETA